VRIIETPLNQSRQCKQH